VHCLALAPDGKTLALGTAHSAMTGGSMSGKLTFWELGTGKQVGKINLGSSVAASLAFAPEGKTLASRDASGTIQFWDVATGNNIGK
jgi:WD40 repeat protein